MLKGCQMRLFVMLCQNLKGDCEIRFDSFGVSNYSTTGHHSSIDIVVKGFWHLKKTHQRLMLSFPFFLFFFYQISWQLRSSLIVFKAGNLRYLTSKDYQLESYKWLLALFQSKWKMSIGNTYRWMFLTFEFFLTQLLLLISFPFLFIANTWRVSVF